MRTCVVGVLLLAGVALAFPGPAGSSWRRAANDPDRDVEAVDPVRRGGSRPGWRPDASDASEERPEVVPFGIGGFGLRGLAGLGSGFRGVGGMPYGPRAPVFPGRQDSDEDSDEDVPGGYMPTGVLHPYFLDPMSNFMAQMAEMMTAMRREMSSVLNRLPSESTDFSKLGNTTSTTKVIDGHVVTVNDTVIGGEDGEDSVIHIRVVDVHPSETPSTEDGDDKKVGSDADVDADDSKDERPSSTETVESKPNRDDNEIPMKPHKRAARSTPRGDITISSHDEYEGDEDGDQVQQRQLPVFQAEDVGQQRQLPVFQAEDVGQQRQLPVFQAEDVGQQRQLPVFQAEEVEQQRQLPVFQAREVGQQRQLQVFQAEDVGQQRQLPVFQAEEVGQQRQLPVFRAREVEQQRQLPVYQSEEVGQQHQRPVYPAGGGVAKIAVVEPGSGRLRMLPSNRVNVVDQGGQGDLSRDTLVNTLLEQQHSRAGLILVDPDAELMDVRDGKVVATYTPGQGRKLRRTNGR